MPIEMEEEEAMTGGEQIEITEPTQGEQEEEEEEVENSPRQDEQIGMNCSINTYWGISCT